VLRKFTPEKATIPHSKALSFLLSTCGHAKQKTATKTPRMPRRSNSFEWIAGLRVAICGTTKLGRRNRAVIRARKNVLCDAHLKNRFRILDFLVAPNPYATKEFYPPPFSLWHFI
jgi:hypothetical protein